MEFKDKLKTHRQARSLTQAQLAEAIFVSRSTVAKWENGLGLPGPDSMKALEDFFSLEPGALATTEPEAVITEKNRKLRRIAQVTGWAALLALMAVLSLLPFAIQSGLYGLTPEMAAGSYADSDYIDTGDYRIYYFQFEGDWEDGRHWTDLQGWRPVEKHFWGCTVSEADYAYRVITKDNYVMGRLYSIRGKDGYYNLLCKAKIYQAGQDGGPLVWDIPAELITATAVTISGTEYRLQYGFFFTTPDPVEYFQIDGAWYDVE